MKTYKITITVDVLAHDDPLAREAATRILMPVDEALYEQPYGYKLQEVLPNRPPRKVSFDLPELPSEAQPCAFFRSYHHDDPSWYVAVTEEEFAQLQRDEDQLGRGNWTELASAIMDREHLNNPNLDRCVEIAVC